MKKGAYEIIDCHLVFTKTQLKHWIFRFLDSEIQHVYAILRQDDDWVVVNPIRSHIQIDVVPVAECPTPRHYEPDGVFLPVKTTINKNNIVHGFGVLSCVSIVKSLLGIRKRFILTPFQLFKYMRGKDNG